MTNICVVVLGDIGRSPRMQYHVKSLIDSNFTVDLIGYAESAPIKEIQQSGQVKIHKLIPFPNLNLPNILNYIFKTFWQILSLSIALFNVRRSHCVLCQNPPAIPVLFVCYFYTLVTRCRLIIDWHNYAYSIMALNSSERHPLVRLAKWIEEHFGRKAWAHLCVTKAMQEDLLQNWQIKATVLYDRSPSSFQSISINQKHELFKKLSNIYKEFNYDEFEAENAIESTAFTKKLSNNQIAYKANRPGILFSSTSWTPDEDFSILFKALDEYEREAQQSNRFPKLLCVITGKGPQQNQYLKMIESKNWQKVSVITPWLESEDYPLLIASADLGVCLHWSSSGLDLPMKVVDMFGCGLPVCAINFNCLNELVQHEQNGFIFENYQQLSQQIIHWFEDFPNNVTMVNLKETFQKNLKQFQSIRWNDNWNENALPLFT